MNQEKELDKIFDAILDMSEIRCTKCDEKGFKANSSGYQSAETFQAEGWRATKNNIYCPSCAKELKPKKSAQST